MDIDFKDNIQVEKHRKDTNNNYRYILITSALHIYILQMMNYLSNRSQFLWVYRRDNPCARNVGRTREKLKVFNEFTGTINHRFLTNQNARTILVIL